MGSFKTRTAVEFDTLTETGAEPTQSGAEANDHAPVSEVGDTFSEKVAVSLSILAFAFESETETESKRGTAESEEDFVTGASGFPARSTSAVQESAVSDGFVEVSQVCANSRTNEDELPVHAEYPDGVPTHETVKSETRREAQETGSDMVTRSPSIFQEADLSMVSTVEICGGRESTVTTGLTTPDERFQRRSFADMRNVTSASITGTVQSTEPSFAMDSPTECHTPAQVAYSTVIHADWSTQEIASVIFAGFQERDLTVSPFQNSPFVGTTQTSEATVGHWESL